MDCACLVHNTCGYCNKEVYLQLIRSTTRRYFSGRQLGPVSKCIYPKNNLQKTLESRKFNEENFCTTRKSYKFHENIALLFVLETNVGKALISVEDLRQSKNQSRHNKRYIFEGSLPIRGTYFHAFKKKRPNRLHLVRAQKLWWSRAPRSLNPSLHPDPSNFALHA